MSRFSYEITSLPAALGGGWHLRLMDHGKEMGGGNFPVPPAVPAAAATWWANLDEAERQHWYGLDATNPPLGSYHAFMLAEQYAMAEALGQAWTDRPEQRKPKALS